MKSEKQIRRRIAQLESKIERLEKIANTPNSVPGPLATGRSNYSMGKRLDIENAHRERAFKALTQAQAELVSLKEKLADYLSGERHINGQPRADSPSRKRAENAKQLLAEFMRGQITTGDIVAVAFNPQNRLTIKRVNKKSITDSHDVIWHYDEIRLLIDGKLMGDDEFKWLLKSWLAERESDGINSATIERAKQ